jgi:hypothetical protein
MTMIVVLHVEMVHVQLQLKIVIIAQQIVKIAVEIISAIMVKHAQLALEIAPALAVKLAREEYVLFLQSSAEMVL